MKYEIVRASNRWTKTPPVDWPGITGGQEGWVIEVTSLEQLMELADREGELVVSPEQEQPNWTSPQKITIYDDYIE